jgi:aminomuconate-semialdehyde/2-hydroxymuconate-6-semialdehyde dehydrogenase
MSDITLSNIIQSKIIRSKIAMSKITVAGRSISSQHFIDNQRVASSQTFEVRSAIDEAVLGQVARGGESEVNLAVAAAKRAFPAWAVLGPRGRFEYLEKLAHIIEARVEDLAIVETTNNGSLLEASRLRVMKRGAHNIHHFAELALQMGKTWDTEAAKNAVNSVRYDPAGVTALITPWNAPFMLATWKVGPALAAGNTVVLKPAEWTPLTASLLADFVLEAGFPPGVFNVVQGFGKEAGAALVAHPDVKRISFTGSVPTAQSIAVAAAKNLTPVSFELGGKSPFIVFADSDLDLVIKNAVDQYDNCGQVCLSGTRMLIEDKIHDEFLVRFREAVAKTPQGDPRDATTVVGPLVTRQHLERVDGFVQRAKEAGAKLEFGGRVSPTLGHLYYEPTLFTQVPENAEILQREVFGPVLALQTFSSEDELIKLANSTEYGLAAMIFTKDQAKAERIASQVVAGTVWINCFFVRDLDAPFGGSRQSGVGREGGHWSFDFYCDVKNVVYRKGTFA